MSSRRRQGGATAQAHGEAWESHVRYALDALVVQGRIACWWRQEPPVRVVGSGSSTRIVRTGKGPPDYLVASAGWTWAIEAKAGQGDRLPWGRIEAHQAEALSAWGSGVARRRAALLVRYMVDRRPTDVLMPWSAVAVRWRAWQGSARASAGEGSLSLADALEVGTTRWGDALAGEAP